MIDILFVHSNASSLIYQDLSKDHSAIEPPIWAGMLLNSVLSYNGFSAELLDCEVLRLTNDDAIEHIKYLDPKIVCFVVYGQQPSASSQNMEGAVSLAEDVKINFPGKTIVFIGGHVAALPHETLHKHSFIDVCCQNEGVYSIRKLIECIKNNGDLYSVSGIYYRDKKTKQITATLPPLVVSQQDLQRDLPGTNWKNLPNLNLYRTAGWHALTNNGDKSPFAALYTSLGCPFSCKFCCINIINRTTQPYGLGKSLFRYWQPEHIIKQFDYFAQNNIKNIKIADELFVYKEEHFLKLCNLIIERKYKFNIWCYGRLDTCKPKYLEVLKKAGVNWIGLGIESSNTKVRKDVAKGHNNSLDIRKIVQDIKDAGIEVGANYIFGLPEDTMETMQETYDLSIELDTAMVNFYTAMAYPGSQLYVDALNKGYKLPQTYSGYSQHSYDTQNLPSNYLSAAEILKFRDTSWYNYHSRPEFLQKILDKFGQKAYNTTVDSLKIELKRKLYTNEN